MTLEKTITDAFSKTRHVIENEFEGAHLELKHLHGVNSLLLEEYLEMGDKVRLFIEKKDKEISFDSDILKLEHQVHLLEKQVLELDTATSKLESSSVS